MKPIAGSLALAILSGGVALADIPVDDDQQLTQKTLTQTTTTSTVPVQQNNNKGQGGINCATHQGQKGTTQNNTAQPNTATGNTAVQQYDPQSATAPANPTDRAWGGDTKFGSDGGRASWLAMPRRKPRSRRTVPPIKRPQRASVRRRRLWLAMTRIRRSERKTV